MTGWPWPGNKVKGGKKESAEPGPKSCWNPGLCAPTSRSISQHLAHHLVPSAPVAGPVVAFQQQAGPALAQASLHHMAVAAGGSRICWVLKSSQSCNVSLSSWGLRFRPDLKYQLSPGDHLPPLLNPASPQLLYGSIFWSASSLCCGCPALILFGLWMWRAMILGELSSYLIRSTHHIWMDTTQSWLPECSTFLWICCYYALGRFYWAAKYRSHTWPSLPFGLCVLSLHYNLPGQLGYPPSASLFHISPHPALPT